MPLLHKVYQNYPIVRRFIILLVGTICLFLCASCNSRSDLYEQTDYFVTQLSATYQSYGLQGLSDKRFTKDRKYGVTPMGRLIIVRFEQYATSDEYESLRKDLERHYKKDHRVNRVYINQGGTVVIDCRN